MKLYTEQGVMLYDDDLEDPDLIKETLVMSVLPPQKTLPHVISPSTPKLVPPLPMVRTYTDDTISLHSWVSSVSTPDGSESESERTVSLPVFSNALDKELRRFGNRACDVDSWKKVRKSYRTDPTFLSVVSSLITDLILFAGAFRGYSFLLPRERKFVIFS